MNPTLMFAGGAVLLLAAVLFVLLRPLRRRPAGADISRRQLNAAIYRDELADLDKDLAEGSLSQADYDTACAELQRRLLEDSSAPDAEVAAAPLPAQRTMLALALGLPVLAAALYLGLGNPAALNAPPEQRFSSADIDRMVQTLADKLEKEPNNPAGWVMLARSYKAMGRLPDALRAFERAGSVIDGDSEALLSYADTLASSVGGFDAQVNGLIDKALRLDPNSAQGLWMRGTAAFEAGRFDKAAADWERLLALLQPGSEDARIVAANIDEARQKGGLPPAGGSANVGAGKTAQAPANAFIKGRVELAKHLQAPAGAVVMVVARPNDGSRMPAAVFRVAAGTLPLAFTLDDSQAMSPDRRLSQFAELVVEARISQSGQAMPQPGDLFGPPHTVKPGAKNVVLKIDQVRQ